MQINKVELSPGVTKRSSYPILQSSEKYLSLSRIVAEIKIVKIVEQEEIADEVEEQEQYSVVKNQKKSWRGSIKLFNHLELVATI